MVATAHSPWHVVSRVCACVLGSYAFTWGFVATGAALLIAAGMEFHEASSLVSMLAFLVFLAAFCWSFVSPSLARVWIVLAGGGALLTLAGWWLARVLA